MESLNQLTDELLPYFAYTNWRREDIVKWLQISLTYGLLYTDVETATVCFGRRRSENTVEVLFIKGNKTGMMRILTKFKLHHPNVKTLTYHRFKKHRDYFIHL